MRGLLSWEWMLKIVAESRAKTLIHLSLRFIQKPVGERTRWVVTKSKFPGTQNAPDAVTFTHNVKR